jgi:hypothetical protein
MATRFPCIATALLAACTCAFSQELAAVVRKDGLLVFIPGAGGPSTYGTYLVPAELGRGSLDRFQYLGNPLQVNFLPASELPPGFAGLDGAEKLAAFFQAESRHLSKAFGQEVEFSGFEKRNVGGAECLSAVAGLGMGSEHIELRTTARAAGNGILHASYQNSNPATAAEAQAMVEKLIGSFQLVPHPFTPGELASAAEEARE